MIGIFSQVENQSIKTFKQNVTNPDNKENDLNNLCLSLIENHYQLNQEIKLFLGLWVNPQEQHAFLKTEMLWFAMNSEYNIFNSKNTTVALLASVRC